MFPYKDPFAHQTFEVKEGAAPPTSSETGRLRLYPFNKMELAQYIDVPSALAKSARSAAAAFARKHGRKFISRQIENEGRKMVRIWRIE